MAREIVLEGNETEISKQTDLSKSIHRARMYEYRRLRMINGCYVRRERRTDGTVLRCYRSR
jgi:hypothetical protein